MRALILGGTLFFLVTLWPASCPGFLTLDGFDINPTGSAVVSGAGVRAVLVQPWDGKILIGGDFTLVGGSPAV